MYLHRRQRKVDIEDDGNPATESGVTIPVQSVPDEANIQFQEYKKLWLE
jgi:hypothetical protein